MPLTLLIHLDGTCYAKGTAIPGAAEAIAQLRRMGCRLRFLTNTDSKPADAILAQLSTMGLCVEPPELFTAVDSCLHYLDTRDTPSVLALVPQRIQPLFARFPTARDSADYVVLGDPRFMRPLLLVVSRRKATASSWSAMTAEPTSPVPRKWDGSPSSSARASTPCKTDEPVPAQPTWEINSIAELPVLVARLLP